MPALVLCGGRGTRLESVTGSALPKALVQVSGRPFIDHKLVSLRDMGLADVVLSIGFGGDQIREHVGDGSQHGIVVRYVDDGEALLGTGGAVRAALAGLPDFFWVTYGDSLVSADIEAVERVFHRSGRSALMTVLRTHSDDEQNNALVHNDNVVRYSKDPRPRGAQHVDYGLLVLSQDAFQGRQLEEPFDLAAVLGPLASENELAAFEVDQPFHEIGSPSALLDTEAYLAGRARAR